MCIFCGNFCKKSKMADDFFCYFSRHLGFFPKLFFPQIMHIKHIKKCKKKIEKSFETLRVMLQKLIFLSLAKI
jgi:hypothetical protein